ncbi:MAG TPA: helix-turn-helix transcriptional regulator [Longimicrobiales bacterium]|nr:helix-turn-helix transcriptional regulator [Longimicrobiales bacterium]
MSESLGEQIRHILREAPFAMRQLAADAGLSYDVLRSWRSGRRRPSRTSAVRLAAGLQQRGELLLRLAAELQAAAEPPGQARAREEGASRPDAGSSRPDTARAMDTGSPRTGEATHSRTGDGPGADEGRAEPGFGRFRPGDSGDAGSMWRHGAGREGGAISRDAPMPGRDEGPGPDEASRRPDSTAGDAAAGDSETGTSDDWRP